MKYEIFQKMQLCRLKISDIQQEIQLLLQHLNPFTFVPSDHHCTATELFLKYIFFLLN